MTMIPARAGRALTWIFSLVLGCMLLVSGATSASAHTAFDSSDPADGAIAPAGLAEIALAFTSPADPGGSGFEVLDGSGASLSPVVETTDRTVYRLRFEQALASGAYGVRWEVRAADAHPISGTFRFAVEAAAPSSTAQPGSASEETPPAPADVRALDAILADSGSDASLLNRLWSVGGFLAIWGTILGVGAVAALVLVVRGGPAEIGSVLWLIRGSAAAAAIGGAIELAALVDGQLLALGGMVGAPAATAGVLKIAGGLTAVVAFSLAGVRNVGVAVAGGRWRMVPVAWIGLAGFAALLGSYWFDGHTVSRGPWFLHAAANLVHVVAAAVWAGGVMTMALVAWRRRRSVLPTDLAGMVVRFSGIAGGALAAVVVAGSVMTLIVLDNPAEIVTTEWGRVLVGKVTAVAIAAALGGYNHVRLRPELERDPDGHGVTTRVRRSLAVEAVIMLVVVVLTAWLVTAAT